MASRITADPAAILVVEPHATSRARMCRALEGAGYRLRSAAGMARARGELSRTAFDLVLAPAGRPGPARAELVREIRAAARGLPAVLLVVSARWAGDPGDVGASGADDHLVAPLDDLRLVMRVATVLGSRDPGRGPVPAEPEALARREAILAAVAFTARHLLGDPENEPAIDEALLRLGSAAGASRAYVCQKGVGPGGGLTFTLRHEWTAPGVEPGSEVLGPDGLPDGSGGPDGWAESLARREPGTVRSLAVEPVFVEDEWWGLMGFDDSRREREWAPAEVDALRTAADVLGAAIASRRSLAALREREELLRGAHESSLDALFLLAGVRDEDGRVVDFRLTDLNRRGEELIGRPREEVVGAPLGELPPFDRGHMLVTRLAGVAETGTPLEEELYSAPVGGERRWLHQQVVRVGDGIAVTVRDITERKRAEAEESARRRVATAVASADDPAEVFVRAAEEATRLLEADAGVVMRSEGPSLTTVGSWAVPGLTARPPGTTMLTSGSTAIARAMASGRPARNDRLAGQHEASGVGDRSFLNSSVAAPIHVGDELWGALAVGSVRESAFSEGDEARLEHFARLVALAIGNAEARARLVAQASTDPLTGLANHRVFHERLAEEISRALRHGHPLSLVLMDLDHFKKVNDGHGHLIGDEVLVELSRRVAGHAREGDTVARVGGEELAWLLPLTDGESALTAAERLRRAIEETAFGAAGRVTASFGVADLVEARDPGDLVQQADVALYWAKALGRNRCVAYSFGVAEELFAHQSASRLTGSPTMRAMRALAWAVDAKDPYTHRHSERVADLAVALAAALGWSPRRCAMIREAGLVHDVGLVAVPDAILFKPARLSDEEMEQVKRHAAVGATIVGDVLTAEQASWVRGHHERWDGAGYPDRLAGEAIPEGARILCLADSWDVMTSARSYHGPRGIDEALEEVRRCSGTHFSPAAAETLVRLGEAGLVEGGARPVGPRSTEAAEG